MTGGWSLSVANAAVFDPASVVATQNHSSGISLSARLQGRQARRLARGIGLTRPQTKVALLSGVRLRAVCMLPRFGPGTLWTHAARWGADEFLAAARLFRGCPRGVEPGVKYRPVCTDPGVGMSDCRIPAALTLLFHFQVLR